MLVRKEKMRASSVMQQRVLQAPNIKVYWNSEAEEVLGESKVEGLRIRNNQTNETQTIPLSGFFVAIGHEPNSAIFKPWIEMDEAGYIQTIAGSSKTNIEGVFCSRRTYRIKFTGRQ